MERAFIDDLITGNCKKYKSPEDGSGIYDSTQKQMRTVYTDMGSAEIPTGEYLLVGYLTLDGEICDNNGDVVAKFGGFTLQKFSLFDADNNLLGSGSFHGNFSDGNQDYYCPVLSDLANKAETFINMIRS